MFTLCLPKFTATQQEMLYNLCKNPIQFSSENKEKNHRKKETGEKLPANI